MADCQHDAGSKTEGAEVTDRYAVINPDTLEAMRRAGHVAKLEARIEKLEAALREIVKQERQTAHPVVCHIIAIARKALEETNGN